MKILLELSDMIICLLFLITFFMAVFFAWASEVKRSYKIAFIVVGYVMYYFASAYSHHLFLTLIKNLK